MIASEAIDSGGILVDISSSCATLAISSSVRAGSLRQPGVRRCLRRGDPRDTGAGPKGAGHGTFHADRPLSAFHEDLEFRSVERQVVGRWPEPTCRAPFVPNSSEAPSGLSLGRS